MSGYPRVYDSASGPSASSSSGLMVFGLVIGALLLVPLLVVCGSSSSGGNDSVFSSTSETTEGETGNIGDLVRDTAAGLIASDAGAESAGAASTAVLDTVAEPQTYTVQDGDSLWAISNQFGITVEALQSANGIGDAATIDVGQILKIPSAPAAGANAAGGGTAGAAGNGTDEPGGAVAAGE